jgi:dipeptidyl aminopeptidase/acylaminoacyl peptidase
MKRDLEHVEIQGEHEARERTWGVVSAAFAERAPMAPPGARRLVPALVVVAIAAVISAAASSPGRAVLQRIRETVGVEKAQPALFSLPSEGRLLVVSDAGLWVVRADGSKRLLGRYDEASWSPHGRYVAAARRNELAALEPNGRVRWTLARAGVRRPRWTGSNTDTRIAYADRSGLRVVAGDGTGDRLVAAHADGPHAWRPGASGFELGYVSGLRQLRVVNVQTRHTLVRKLAARTAGSDSDLLWSPDGRRLLVVDPSRVTIVDMQRTGQRTIRAQRGSTVESAAFSPDGRALAVLETTQLLLFGRDKVNTPAHVFAGQNLHGLVWSPDGRWLVVGLPRADQWVFVDAHSGRIRAVSNVSAQFRTDKPPMIAGWVG